MAIIIEGNVFDGHTFHGPFGDVEAAIEWAEQNLRNVDWLVASLCNRPNPFDALRDVEAWITGEGDGAELLNERDILERVREALTSASDLESLEPQA